MIVAGFGLRRGATGDALRGALEAALSATGTAGIDAVATAADKVGALVLPGPALPRFAVPLHHLRHQTATPSPRVPARYGRQSLAEAAALAAAGPGARLLGPRAVSACGTATCALARRPSTFDAMPPCSKAPDP